MASRKRLNEDEYLELLNRSDSESSNFSDSDDDWLPTDDENHQSSSDEELQMEAVPEAAPDQVAAPVQVGAPVPIQGWSRDVGLPVPFEFAGNPGIKINILDPTNILEYVKIFIGEDFVTCIRIETNRYANQVRDIMIANNLLTRHSLMYNWRETNNDELYTYFGLSLLMGIIHKPKIQMYWSENLFLQTPIFSSVMSRDRFLQIRLSLHFNNNLLPQPDDKLFKIRFVLDHLVNLFQEIYIPNCQLAVDEILQKWKGRLSFRQYIPSKRARFGIKLFLLCEVKTNYTYKLIIYTGQGTALELQNPIPGIDKKKLFQSTNVVLCLAEKLLFQGYTITCDNWYGSPELSNIMIKVGTDCFGTIRSNRVDLPEHFNIEPKINDPIIFQRGKVMVMRWRDLYKKKKIVNLISTIHDGSEMPTGKFTREGEEKVKPTIILDYNATMGAVDCVSQITDPYKCARKGRKWYRKLFEYLMDIAILNSYILFKINNPTTKLSHLDFITNAVENLIEKHCYGLRNVRRPIVDNTDRLTGRHFPNTFPPTEKKKSPARRCKVCYKKNIRKETRYMCRLCDCTPLCIEPCFQIYHTVKNYENDDSDDD